MSEYAIEIDGLTKYYGRRQVVAPLSLKIPRGSIFGFLGRNGAGKSTTIRMLMGLVEPTRGSATVLGCDCQSLTPEIRARIGYLAEGHNVYDWMTVDECRRFQSGFYPRWNDSVFDGVVDRFGLDRKTKAKNLSRGERAGLCLALTLAPEPELLVLDDPALGLDPVARRGLLQAMVYVTRQSDRTILFSSHLLSEVERVADRIGVMTGGRLMAECSIDTFQDRIREVDARFDGAPPSLPKLPGLLSSLRGEDGWLLTFANYTDETRRAVEALGPRRIDEIPLGLEDAFVQYTGRREASMSFLQESREAGQ